MVGQRVDWLAQFDVVSEVSFTAADAHASPVVLASTPDAGGGELDLTVRVCAPQGTVDTPTSAELRLRVPVGDGHSVAWTLAPFEETPPGVYLPDGCIGFHRRQAADPAGEVVLAWADVPSPGSTVELRAGFAARRPLSDGDRSLVLLILAGALILVLGGQRTPPTPSRWSAGQAAIGLLAFLAAPFVLVIFAGTSPAGSFAAMVGSTALYVAVLCVMAHRGSGGRVLSALAFHRISTRHWWLALGAALVAIVVALSVLTMVPRSESAMTRLLEPSSGLMRVTAFALITPWAEEIFFRGVLYGALERAGGAVVAVTGSTLIFSLLHLDQHLGNLGPWAVVTVTGLILSLVRWRTGSTLASTLTHLTYNVILVLPTFLVG